MKTIRTRQIIQALNILKARRISRADRSCILFKLRQITLDKQMERRLKKWKSR